MHTPITTPSKLPRYLWMTAAVVIIIAGLHAASGPVTTILVAAFLAILSYPLVTWLQAKRAPRLLAILLVVALDALVLFGVGLLFARVITDLMLHPERIEHLVDDTINILSRGLVRMGVKVPGGELSDFIGGNDIIGLASDAIGSAAEVASGGLFVVLTMIFILVEAASLPWKLRAALGNAKADLSSLARITAEIQRYLRLKTIINLLTGGAMALFVAAMGMSYPLLWGIAVFFLNYVPSLGSLIAAAALSIVAAMEVGLLPALIVAIGSIVIHTILLNLIEPAWLGRRFGLSVLTVFLSLILWGSILGPIGMLFAVPLTMVVKIGLENIPQYKWIAVLLEPSPPAARPPRPKPRKWIRAGSKTIPLPEPFVDPGSKE